jgi:hypothetical protein
MEDASKDLLQRYGAKQEELYVRFEKELKEIQRAIQVSRAVSTAPSSSKTAELGMNQPNFEDWQMQQRLGFSESKKRRNRLQKP